MNLDSLLRIRVDALLAFAAMNLINMLRRGVVFPRVKRWLNAPSGKAERRKRLIGLAAVVSGALSILFTLRAGAANFSIFVGECGSRAIVVWLLSMGQFDVVKLVWPDAFGQKEDENADNMDAV